LIAKYTPAAPVTVQPTDTFPEVPGGWQHKRGAVVLGTYLRKNMTRTVLSSGVFISGATQFAFYQEEAMPGLIATQTAVHLNTTTGALRVNFASGNEREWTSVADAKSDVAYLDTDPKTAEDIILAKMFKNSPDNTNLENMVGGSCSIDLAAAVPVVLTEPE
jgi:hypothetical protein